MDYVKNIVKLLYKYKVGLASKNRILLNNIFGIFETDSKGKPLKIKKFGNGAMIPFSRKYLDKRVVVLLMDK